MTEQKEVTRKELDRSASIIGLVILAIGLASLYSSSSWTNIALNAGTFIIGLGLVAAGMVVLFSGGELGEKYLARKRALEADQRGIIWVWVVALTTWAIMAVAYFSLSIIVYMVLDSIEAFYPFGSEELGVLSLTRNVCAWFLIIMTIGIIGWALINSARREDQTYPSY